MLKYKKGEIFIKVFLKIEKMKIKKSLKIIKIVKIQKGNIFIKVFLKMKINKSYLKNH